MFFRHSKPKEPSKLGNKRSRAGGTILQWCFKKFDEGLTQAQICRERPEISPRMVRRYHALWRHFTEVASYKTYSHNRIGGLNGYFSESGMRARLLSAFGRQYHLTEEEVDHLLLGPPVLTGPVTMEMLRLTEGYRMLLVLSKTLTFLERWSEPGADRDEQGSRQLQFLDKALLFMAKHEEADHLLSGFSLIAQIQADNMLGKPRGEAWTMTVVNQRFGTLSNHTLGA